MPKFEKCTGYLVTDNFQWFPVAYTGTISASDGAVGAEFVSALGQRTVFARGSSPREWSVSALAPWAWARALKALARQPHQRLYWLSPLGIHTNVLPSASPQQGTSLGIREVDGYPVEVYGPFKSYAASVRVPVKAGSSVYGSCYLAGGHLQVEFYNAADKRISTSRVTKGGATLSYVQTPQVAVPDGAVYAVVVAGGTPLLVGQFSLFYEVHGMAESGESECSYVTLHDVRVKHSNLAYKDSPFDVSFTLKEVS